MTKNNRRAFSLLELLLGLLIFSAISLGIGRIFLSGLIVEKKTGAINKIYHEARLFFTQLSRDLGNLTMYDYSGSYPQREALAVKDGTLSLIVRTENGLKNVRYYLVEPVHAHIHKVVVAQKSSTKISGRYSEKSEVRHLIREEQPLIESWQKEAEVNSERRILSRSIQVNGLGFGIEKSLFEAETDEPSLPAAIQARLVFTDLTDRGKEISFEKSISIPLGFQPVRATSSP